jgi:hypothetical protein
MVAGMRRVVLTGLALALAVLAIAGCVMPAGEQVVVDRRGGGDVFTGSAVLLEIGPDGAQCRVAVRNTALFVEKRWVDCRYVHSRPAL